MGTTRLTKVLMDEGNGLNILYASTLDKMGIPHRNMCASKAPFYGIMPGKEVMPLRHIWLNVTFDQPNNFCKEPLTFEVVDFPGIYLALLGRPCLAKFMAVPNYTYLKLKMPGLKGVITVEGSFKQAYYYEQDFVVQADALIAPYALDDPGHDIGGAPAEEATKAVVVLD
ncbi:uncharacterized protein [Miscanthus floridulus]|uniref:uncharacterized protein n=1 Tax=Miscanthus floridulus TaxID=154761 RepID=UPI00345A9191